MTLSLVLATFAAMCGLGASYGPRAPGDEFQAEAKLRRWGGVLAVVAGLVALGLLGMHGELAVACFALLWSMALCGPLLCCLRRLGAPRVLGFGTLALLGAVVGILER